MTYLGSESLLIFSVKLAYNPKTWHFKDLGIQPLSPFTIFTIINYDSFVFHTISYKIGIAHIVIDREMGWKRFILGRALPRLSQAVLRGGQQYYLWVSLVSSRLPPLDVSTKDYFPCIFPKQNTPIRSFHPSDFQKYGYGIVGTAHGFNVMPHPPQYQAIRIRCHSTISEPYFISHLLINLHHHFLVDLMIPALIGACVPGKCPVRVGFAMTATRQPLCLEKFIVSLNPQRTGQAAAFADTDGVCGAIGR
jgi:hypothetical protein